MSKFSNFMIAYSEMQKDKGLQINPSNSKQFGWKIGVNAKAAFEKHLDEQGDVEFEPEVKERFKNMFTKGNEMMAVNVISNPSGSRANKVVLYKIKAKKESATIKNVSFKGQKILHSCPTVTDPQGGKFTWKYGLNSNCITIKDSVNVYIDEAGKGNGTFADEDKGVAVNGTINYQTGEIKIHRMSDHNEQLALNFEKEYNEILNMQTSALTGSGGSGSGSSSGSSGGSSSSASQSIGKALNKKHGYYDKDDFEINYTAFYDPVKIIWEYDITADDESEEN